MGTPRTGLAKQVLGLDERLSRRRCGGAARVGEPLARECVTREDSKGLGGSVPHLVDDPEEYINGHRIIRNALGQRDGPVRDRTRLLLVSSAQTPAVLVGLRIPGG